MTHNFSFVMSGKSFYVPSSVGVRAELTNAIRQCKICTIPVCRSREGWELKRVGGVRTNEGLAGSN